MYFWWCASINRVRSVCAGFADGLCVLLFTAFLLLLHRFVYSIAGFRICKTGLVSSVVGVGEVVVSDRGASGCNR